MMTSLRRRQIRSTADDENFLSLIQNLHFEICSLERETRQLTERPQVDHQPPVVGRPGRPSGNDDSGPVFQHQARTNQFLAALDAYESSQLQALTSEFLAALAANELSQHLRNTLSRLRWTLEPEKDSESHTSEEVEAVAENEEAEEVTIQDSQGEENHQEALNDAGMPSDPGQDAKGGNRNNIFGCFADVWNCAWN